MTNEIKPASSNHGGYERRDISVASVAYFLVGLIVAGLIIHFVATNLYHFFESRSEAQQTSVSPLVTNAPKDTRKLPPAYNEDYEKYLKSTFPAPQLEINERNQLDNIRLNEENTLSTYDYIDQKAGTIRIPIDRAMDLIAQRGLPVRAQAGEASASGANAKNKTKGAK